MPHDKINSEASIDHREKFAIQNLNNWQNIINSLFTGIVPEMCTWSGITEIIELLNKIGSTQGSNHTLLPSKGGLDLAGAKNSIEKDCIELEWSSGSASIIKPQSLTLNWFGVESSKWAYFRLETLHLEPTGVYDKEFTDTHLYEEVTEIAPGQYIDRSTWDVKFYDGDNGQHPLPNNSRLLIRTFSGAFVIVAKSSPYNGNPNTYDARHNQMTATQFRNYIQNQIQLIKQ